VNFLSLLEAKRDGKTLTVAQLRAMVAGVISGQLPDYQIASYEGS